MESISSSYSNGSTDPAVVAMASFLEFVETKVWNGRGLEDHAYYTKKSEEELLKVALTLIGIESYPYEKQEEWKSIGRGSFGLVFTNGEIAMKRVDSTVYEEWYELALLEIIALKRLRSPYVINLRAARIEGEAFYLYMDLAVSDCTSLKAEKKHLVNMTECLVYIHDLDIIHGDVKPANYLIMQDGRIVIADFGLCILHPKVKTFFRGFSLLYRDPEKVGGFKGDVWALGCTFLSILAGSEEVLVDIINTLKTLDLGEYNTLLSKIFEDRPSAREVLSYL